MIFGIWKADTMIFACVMAIACGLSGYEVTRVTGIECKMMKAFSALFGASVPLVLYFDLKISGVKIYVPLIFVYLIIMTALLLKNNQKVKFHQFAVGAFGTVFFSYCLSLIVLIGDAKKFISPSFNYIEGVYLTVFAFCISWLTDAFAYFVGSKFGKHRLCKNISPKKSVEGAVAGFILSIILNIIIYAVFKKASSYFVNIPLSFVIIMSGVLAALSMMGDLFASLIKRNFSAKDFGNVLPGHGGALDRFDSCVFVFPVLYFGLKFIV